MEPDDFSAAEAEDRRERKCAQELGMDMRELRVLQSPQFTAGTSDKPTLAYVSEHKGHIQLTLVSPGPGKPTLKGACVFVTGNHGRAEVSVETPLDVLYIESGGQQSQVTVLVDNRGRIGQPRVFLNGIQERVTITGPQEAALGCAQLTRSMSGSHTDVTCQATTP